MTMKRITLAQLPDALRHITGRQVPLLGARVLANLGVELAVRNVELNPVGRPQAMVAAGGIRLPQSPHPGKMRASWRLSAGRPQRARLGDRPAYPVPGAAEFSGAVARLERPARVYLTNDAHSVGTSGDSYSWIIAVLGRRRSSTGRMIGSLQAPRGTILPSLDALRQRGGSLVRRAVRETLRRAP